MSVSNTIPTRCTTTAVATPDGDGRVPAADGGRASQHRGGQRRAQGHRTRDVCGGRRAHHGRRPGRRGLRRGTMEWPPHDKEICGLGGLRTCAGMKARRRVVWRVGRCGLAG